MTESAVIGLRELGEVARDMIFHYHCGALEKAHQDKQSLLNILSHLRGETCYADVWIEEKQKDSCLVALKTLLFSMGDDENPPNGIPTFRAIRTASNTASAFKFFFI